MLQSYKDSQMNGAAQMFNYKRHFYYTCFSVTPHTLGLVFNDVDGHTPPSLLCACVSALPNSTYCGARDILFPLRAHALSHTHSHNLITSVMLYYPDVFLVLYIINLHLCVIKTRNGSVCVSNLCAE